MRVSVALGRALLQMTRLPKAPDDPGPLRRGAITGVATGLGGMLRAHRDRFHPLSLHGRQTRQHIVQVVSAAASCFTIGGLARPDRCSAESASR